MKKLMVLGATGMAGHVIYTYFSEMKKYEMYNVCFRNKLNDSSFILNIRDEQETEKLLNEVKPDIVINCIGVLIKGSKSSPENAIYINGYFPHMLSRVLHSVNENAKLIHISTDCVFSGNKGQYKDNDLKDALDVYGMSKNLGELINNHDLTIRTSIIGPELKENGEGLMHWVFSQRNEGKLNGYTKSIWGGLTTLELAHVIEYCLDSHVTGLYQASNNKSICKYDLINFIVNEFNLKLLVNPVDGVISDKSILNTNESNYEVPSYEKMISDLHVFMNSHKRLYTQYLGE